MAVKILISSEAINLIGNLLLPCSKFKCICRTLYQRQYELFKLSPQQTMIFNAEHELSFCWTRKAASTSWQLFFWHLKGKKVIWSRKKLYL